MFWNSFKRGAGYGLGGRLGWEVGGWLWGVIKQLMTFIGLGLTALSMVMCQPDHSKQSSKPAAQVERKGKPVKQSAERQAEEQRRKDEMTEKMIGAVGKGVLDHVIGN